MRILRLLALALALFAPADYSRAAELVPLSIVSAGGTHAFQVELAADDATRQKGLMFRQELGEDRGMLFDFGRDQIVTMWMRNTYIPLDMLFITKDGKVHRVEERTTPFSERVIESGDLVRYVLEVPGGTAARLGIKRGDQVKSPAIK